jgi:hypothetical protein
MTLNPEDRALFGALADVLIPAAGVMPSASQAGVAGEWLDHVSTARPDLAAGLQDLLDKSRGRPAAEVVAAFQANDPAAFGILAEIVPAAYFMNPDVRRAIGYSGQGPQMIDPHPDYLDEGLLESVISRGPIYRPTPK